jgi:hypothetical protein
LNINKLNTHKTTLFFYLHNSFLKKLTLQYFSVVVRAVPPEGVGGGILATMSSLSISLMLSLSEKAAAMRTFTNPKRSGGAPDISES